MSGNRKSFYRGASAYRRRHPQPLSSGKAFLIVTEGEKTEPNYLKSLRNRLHLNATDVVIVHPEGTDPITLTQKAIDLRSKRRNEAKKGFVIEYDEVWVVFDLEKMNSQRHAQAIQAMNMKDATGIQFAVSAPCFEYWLLLHETFTTRPFSDCNEVMEQLLKYFPDYAKGQDFGMSYLEKVPIAVVNAERCRTHHKASGGNGNPSTKVDILVRNLNSATRAHLQFKLK